ncbi:MAG: hypothetical protein GF383_06265 [Candidatus Lokiarchaeota archaeon]|nr:hypothetical protein [Candidatus Lokiarchaeota archaeon]MBD3339608.1 hypothetical protein [Candidatus Lokiarchaeota archaeon]
MKIGITILTFFKGSKFNPLHVSGKAVLFRRRGKVLVVQAQTDLLPPTVQFSSNCVDLSIKRFNTASEQLEYGPGGI